jgi:hypothetical protein
MRISLLGDDGKVGKGRKEMHHIKDLNHCHLPPTCLKIVLNSLGVLVERDAIDNG